MRYTVGAEHPNRARTVGSLTFADPGRSSKLARLEGSDDISHFLSKLDLFSREPMALVRGEKFILSYKLNSRQAKSLGRGARFLRQGAQGEEKCCNSGRSGTRSFAID